MPRIAKKGRPARPIATLEPKELAPEPPAPAPEVDLAPTEARPDKPVRTLDFFDRMKGIATEDWATRACIYLYRLEPITDRLKGGNSVVYIMKYEEPIDQDRILIDHGSGKYRAVLTFRKAGQDVSDQVDSAIFEMLNTAFPPKIPAGEWVNDARNKKWQWARPLNATPQGEAPPPTSQPGIVETFRLFRDINNDLKQEVKAQQPAAPANAAPPADPVMTGLAIAEKFMAMKADNPMLEVMKTMLEDRRLELAAERERSERLQAELRSKEAQPAQKPGLGFLKDLLGELQSIGAIPEGGLKGLWGKAEGALQAVTRSRMSGTEEFWQPIVTGLLDSIKPVLPMVVARIANQQQQQRPQQQPQQPGAPALIPAANPSTPPPTNGATEAPPMNPELAQAFFSEFGPALVQWFKEAKGEGGDFAEWIFDGYGPDWKGLKWMHLKQAAGTDNIVRLFQTSPFWPEIAAAADKFTEFLKSFVEWQPEAAQAVVDLEEQEAEEIN